MSLLHLVAFLIVFVLGAVVGGFVFRNNPKYLAKIEAEFRAKWEAELKNHPVLIQYKSELSAMMKAIEDKLSKK
jgi:hypothetical protein